MIFIQVSFACELVHKSHSFIIQTACVFWHQ